MTLRVAILGAGIGEAHLGGYAKLPDLFSITHMCDLNIDRVRGACDGYGDIAVTESIDEVLGDPDIDVIDICLPPHLHFEIAMQALAAKKHVICEKPLVGSLAEADQLATRAVEVGRSVFPVFQYRFGIGMAQLEALAEAGLTGRCYAGSLETHWDRPASYYDIPWRGTWQGEQGGALLGHAIHIHDLLPAILGPVAQVYADVATRVNKIEVEDCAALSIRMESGALITSSVTLGCAENLSRLRLMFEGVTVESDHAPYSPAEKPWRFVARAPTAQVDIDRVLAAVDDVPGGYAGFFKAVADRLAERPNRAVTLQDGRQSLEFVTATYASARSNQPVGLPLETSHPLYGGWLP